MNIEQESPHSNAIHVAHNIPTGSDITVTQKNPYNSTVHISLNIAKDCKVKVDMSDAVNSILHVSLNNARMSQVEVTMNNAFNCSVHLRFLVSICQRLVSLVMMISLQFPKSWHDFCQVRNGLSQDDPDSCQSKCTLQQSYGGAD